MTDAIIPYHLLCCTCDACLNGPIPYKLTSAGKTYPTPDATKPKHGRGKWKRQPASVTAEGKRLELAERAALRAKAQRSRERRAG